MVSKNGRNVLELSCLRIRGRKMKLSIKLVTKSLLWLGFIFYYVVSGSVLAADQKLLTDTSQNSITNIDIMTVQGGVMLAKVTLDKPLDSEPIGVVMNNPDRIYFDFIDTTNGLEKGTLDIDEGYLSSINLVQVGDRTRLVLNLSMLVTHNVTIQDGALFIKLQTVSDQLAVQSSVEFADELPGKQENSLLDIDFRRGANGEGRIEVDLLHVGTGIDVRQKGDSVIVEFIKTNLPSNLERKFDVIDFATPIHSIETSVQGENVIMEIKSNGNWEHSARQTDTQFTIEVSALTEGEDKSVRKKLIDGGYAGEKLSLNFQNVDVRAVLQVIADFTELNIIASDTVGGSLTLRLKDVPWDQAFDIILQATGLDKRKTGNVIFVAPRKEMADKELLELEEQMQVTELEPVHTEAYQLNYRTASSISLEGILSNRGMVGIDDISNIMTVTDIAAKLVEVEEHVTRLDNPVRQVLIETRIVEAADTFTRNLGARFGVQGIKGIGNRNLAAGGTVQDSADLALGGGLSDTDALNVNLPAAGVAGVLAGPATLGLSLIKVNNSSLINLELSALESDSKGRIVASPRLITANRVEAKIEQGVEIPFQMVSQLGRPRIRFKKAVLRLKVTPHITPDDNVIMKLDVNQDTRGEDTPAGPAINTKQISTEVLVGNGGTVVIGGIFERTEIKETNKIPLLGDIPLVGHIFRNTTKRDNKRELMIFVTPSILKESLNLR